MPFGPDHDRWADATGSFLLGAMPDDERAGFEEHLAHCAFCRGEVEFLRTAAEALPSAVPQLAPPPELRGRIMAVVEREAELIRAASGEPAPAAPPARAPWWRRLDVLPRRAALALAATALLLLGGLGGALVAGGGPSTETLAGTATRPGTRVELVLTGDQARLEADGLPAPPRGRVYQVWVKRRGRSAPEPTDALFLPAADGSATAGIPASLDGAEAVLVTDEPRGGSAAPTVDPILSVPLSAA